MNIEPVAVFHSPVKGKFGLPRQSGLAASLVGEVELLPPYKREEALRGLEGFDYIWLVWEFSLNSPDSRCADSSAGAGAAAAAFGSGAAAETGNTAPSVPLTVRPPRLGGNTRVGVFASRSPFRPNRLGLSSVKIAGIDPGRGVIHVLGADLADGTPIYDIKPYVPYADSHPEARGGFTDSTAWQPLEVVFECNVPAEWQAGDGSGAARPVDALRELLSQDPRPQYQDDPEREYGLLFEGRNVRFKVKGDTLNVFSIE